MVRLKNIAYVRAGIFGPHRFPLANALMALIYPSLYDVRRYAKFRCGQTPHLIGCFSQEPGGGRVVGPMNNLVPIEFHNSHHDCVRIEKTFQDLDAVDQGFRPLANRVQQIQRVPNHCRDKKRR